MSQGACVNELRGSLCERRVREKTYLRSETEAILIALDPVVNAVRELGEEERRPRF